MLHNFIQAVRPQDIPRVEYLLSLTIFVKKNED